MMTDDRASLEGEAKPWVERNYPGHRNSGGRIVAPFDNDDQMGSILDALARRARAEEPIDMILYCPRCHLQHVDEPDERTSDWTNPPHRSHLCHGCGCIWRPADVATNGVRAIETAGKADNWDAARAPEPSARGADGWLSGALRIAKLLQSSIDDLQDRRMAHENATALVEHLEATTPPSIARARTAISEES